MGVWWWLVVVAELLHNKAQENAWTSRLELYASGTGTTQHTVGKFVTSGSQAPAKFLSGEMQGAHRAQTSNNETPQTGSTARNRCNSMAKEKHTGPTNTATYSKLSSHLMQPHQTPITVTATRATICQITGSLLNRGDNGSLLLSAQGWRMAAFLQ
jgi:hypothetical protein